MNRGKEKRAGALLNSQAETLPYHLIVTADGDFDAKYRACLERILKLDSGCHVLDSLHFVQGSWKFGYRQVK